MPWIACADCLGPDSKRFTQYSFVFCNGGICVALANGGSDNVYFVDNAGFRMDGRRLRRAMGNSWSTNGLRLGRVCVEALGDDGSGEEQ